MTSYSAADLNIAGRGSASAFLEMQGQVIGARLRVTTATEISFAPVIFFQGDALFQCELQFTAPRPMRSAVLAVKLLRTVSLAGCHLFSGFKDSGPYPFAIFRNFHTL